jgi:hypothetical protein
MIKQDLTLEQVIRLPYQTSQKYIREMEDEKAEVLFKELDTHIKYMYTRINGGEGKATLRIKEHMALMSGVKKLEVLYGYFYDKLNNTELSLLR